jgi:hypothetical protein
VDRGLSGFGYARATSAQAFDDLLLVKVGGRVTYHGRIGPSSRNLVQYFEVRPILPRASHTLTPAGAPVQYPPPLLSPVPPF